MHDHDHNHEGSPDDPFDVDNGQSELDPALFAGLVTSAAGGESAGEPVRPVNWNELDADQARGEWLDLNAWVTWLRRTYGLPPTVVPPFWHRHDELVWELSALHTHWLGCYHPDAPPSAPLAWHRDFADTRHRLREWVATCGTRLDRDRPTRQTAWPGEQPPGPAAETPIADRDDDFVQFVIDDVAARRHVEHHLRAGSAYSWTGER
jgi:hypothetical protein